MAAAFAWVDWLKLDPTTGSRRRTVAHAVADGRDERLLTERGRLTVCGHHVVPHDARDVRPARADACRACLQAVPREALPR